MVRATEKNKRFDRTQGPKIIEEQQVKRVLAIQIFGRRA